MRDRLAYVSDVSHRFPPRSAAATAAVALLWAHTMCGSVPKRRVLLLFKSWERSRLRAHFHSSALPPSFAWPCLPLAVLLLKARVVGGELKRRRWRLLRLRNADARRGAATRRIWWPSEPWPPPPLLPLPPPGKPWLPVARGPRADRGPAVRGKEEGATCLRAARTRGPSLLLGPPLLALWGLTRRPRPPVVCRGSSRKNWHSNHRPTSRPRGGPPA
jgi:hypothetical protein